ncbi:MAG TPA: serine/threonine-protein kinase, partial [Thermoanaerobaculia bacterium]|nr:serine/threonine-protein kinase [Thermoanaerobaculia bacterium]
HRLLDEIRVVKMMRPQLGDDSSLKARFFHEARVANQLRHTNIAQLFDFSLDDDGVAFIVMEYVSGVNLETVIRSGSPQSNPQSSNPVSLGLGLEIARQSLRGLGFLHSKNFVHRDISPDNLMLTEGMEGEPLIKLLDLGIAKSLTAGSGLDLTRSGAFLGKIRYAPPEHFGAQGAAAVDARGDLYSFAVLLYELLTGRYPIQGRDPMSLIAGHLHFPPLDFAESDPEGRLPAGLRAVLLKALAKKADDRFPSAQDFSRSLTAYRTLGDIAPGDLETVLGRSGVAPIRRPGSTGSAGPAGVGSGTQGRLDQQFGLRTTPAEAIGDMTQARLVPRIPQQNTVQDAVAAVQAHFARGDIVAAENELQWAMDALGDRTELRDLEEQLQQARAAARERRNEEERTRGIDAVVAEVEAKLARGELRAAEVLLYEAEASWGEQEIFLTLHDRLVAGRRLERAARAEERQRAAPPPAGAPALLAEARALLAAGHADRAAHKLREALDLEPESAEARRLLAEIGL